MSDDIMPPINMKRRFGMAQMSSSDLFIREYQERFEKKLRENEIVSLEHWKAQLDKVIAMRPDGVASIQLQITKISEMMANRIKVLKKE
jgi:hypothetical protein